MNIRLSSFSDTRQVVSRRLERSRTAGLMGSEGDAISRGNALSVDVLIGLLGPVSRDSTWLIAATVV